MTAEDGPFCYVVLKWKQKKSGIRSYAVISNPFQYYYSEKKVFSVQIKSKKLKPIPFEATKKLFIINSIIITNIN